MWLQNQCITKCLKNLEHLLVLKFFSFGIAHVARVGSVFTTVSIPIQHLMLTNFPSQEQRCGRYLHAFAWAIAIIFNIPRFFEFKTTPTILVEIERNSSIMRLDHFSNASSMIGDDGTVHKFHESYEQDFRKTALYVQVYLFWCKLLFIEVIPYVIMISVTVLVRQKLLRLSVVSTGSDEEGE